ncbi:unnamed protein product [Trypanosoma congolense IL3000]|uniref:WGS project CAEQ00000000 data, annotated contig 1050 n=1 Tax=Trypanosoma congolense (strain IL3000) TaxID=1068625 RepID=F9W3G4_TRYCI|nr:unnamed protein product [Trypanosoma congolense IL3000]
MSVEAKSEERGEVELPQSEDGAAEWEEKMERAEEMERLHREGALDLSWVWEAYDAFVKLAEKITELLDDSKRKPEEEGQQKLDDKMLEGLENKMREGLTKWPEYYEKKKAYWRRRLEEPKNGTGEEVVEKELKGQEEQANKLEEELETIEENLAEILEERTTPETGAKTGQARSNSKCPYCDRRYASAGWLKRHVQKEHKGEPDPDMDVGRVTFKCPHGCGKTYKTQGWLNRHLREKHDEQSGSGEVACDSDEDCVKLRCPYEGCNKTYKKMGWLRRHIREKHPDKL